MSKPFVFVRLVMQTIGPEEARKKLGPNATGFPFDLVDLAIESGYCRTNPMVNVVRYCHNEPGGSGKNAEERRKYLLATDRRVSPRRKLPLNEEVW